MNTALNSEATPGSGRLVIQADAIHVEQRMGLNDKGWWVGKQYQGLIELSTDVMTGGQDFGAVLYALKSYMDRGMIKPAQVILYYNGQVIEMTCGSTPKIRSWVRAKAKQS